MIKRPFQPSPYLALAAGVMAASTAAIFIRLAQAEGVFSLTIAAVRLTLASLILTPFALRGHGPALRQLSRRDLTLATISGVMLALHFATWITSLEHTSVLISVVLVDTNPLWVAALAPLLIGERLRRRTLVGILIAFGGGILISWSGEMRPGSDPLLGALLSLAGAVTVAVYMIIGRRLRTSLALLPYIWLCYGVAALFLLLTVLLSGQTLTGHAPVAYLWMLLLAIGPQLIGHSSFNYALGHLPAAYVSLVVLGEPIGSAILAVIFLGEIPAFTQVIGAALILFAVIFARQRQESRQTRPITSTA